MSLARVVVAWALCSWVAPRAAAMRVGAGSSARDGRAWVAEASLRDAAAVGAARGAAVFTPKEPEVPQTEFLEEEEMPRLEAPKAAAPLRIIDPEEPQTEFLEGMPMLEAPRAARVPHPEQPQTEFLEGMPLLGPPKAARVPHPEEPQAQLLEGMPRLAAQAAGVGPRSAPAAPFVADAALRLVEAKHAKTGGQLDVHVPQEWADLFVEGNVRFLGRGFHRTEVFLARLASSPEAQVLFKRCPSHLNSTQREVRVVRVLNASRAASGESHGSIEAIFDVRGARGSTFFLGEAGDKSLEDYMRKRAFHRAPRSWNGLALPLDRSIPLLVDVLRGCLELEAADLTHGGLSPENIYVVGERAIIRGLTSVCRCGPGDSELSCNNALGDTEGGDGPAFGALFWQAPEAWSGSPHSSQDHAWAVGMLFAYMSLGFNPVEEFFRIRRTVFEDWRAARAEMAWFFNIDEVQHFSKLDADVKQVLRGLVIPAEQRWGTEVALRKLELLAEARGITVPGPRELPTLSMPGPGAHIPAAMDAEPSAEDAWDSIFDMW